MIKKTFIFTIALLTFSISKAQVPADSLTGTYIGQFWYANPATNPWTITQDTVYVTNIDSVNCAVQAHDITHFALYPPPPPDTNYYTDYYSCNGIAPTNFYVKFYSADSMRLINDNEPQPPPNQPFSDRFYGKRISNKITSIKELTNNKQVNIYPNPATVDLTIEAPQKTVFEILNIEGQSIKTIIDAGTSTTIDLKSLSSGVYIIKATTDKGVVVKKFIKE